MVHIHTSSESTLVVSETCTVLHPCSLSPASARPSFSARLGLRRFLHRFAAWRGTRPTATTTGIEGHQRGGQAVRQHPRIQQYPVKSDSGRRPSATQAHHFGSWLPTTFPPRPPRIDPRSRARLSLRSLFDSFPLTSLHFTSLLSLPLIPLLLPYSQQ